MDFISLILSQQCCVVSDLNGFDDKLNNYNFDSFLDGDIEII